MPMYEYECRTHGIFEALRPLREAALADECPRCGRGARRVLSASRLAQLSSADMLARDRNERSRHEPRIAHRKPALGGDGHGERPALRASPSPRPWVLEHH